LRKKLGARALEPLKNLPAPQPWLYESLSRNKFTLGGSKKISTFFFLGGGGDFSKHNDQVRIINFIKLFLEIFSDHISKELKLNPNSTLKLTL